MKRIKLSTVLAVAGILLMSAAVILVVINHLSTVKYKEEAAELAEELMSLMPEISEGFIYERSDYGMPASELDGKDYVGILEIPLYSVKLPVAAKWDKSELKKAPCRFAGSVYDGTMVIGGSDNAGQLDFMENITETDALYFTDMSGERFSFTVTEIEKTKDASEKTLTDGDFDLVIFARSSTTFDYTVVRCRFK